jgi:hypothetical protein
MVSLIGKYEISYDCDTAIKTFRITSNVQRGEILGVVPN